MVRLCYGRRLYQTHTFEACWWLCRVRSLGGVVVANKPDRQGESHQYSQASGPYWLHESIKVIVTEHCTTRSRVRYLTGNIRDSPHLVVMA